MTVRFSCVLLCSLLCLALPVRADEAGELRREFDSVVRPFMKAYCVGCHGKVKPKAKFDMSPYSTFESVTKDMGHWKLVLDRLSAKEMPPPKAETQPGDDSRQQVVTWIDRLRRHEASKSAGDPGPVLARRLSNAEYDYSILDLTGVDIRPTRDFPVDPANEAGFDNTGESLTMSPALLTKYLAAARHVANHLLLLPDGIDFAPHPVVVYSDRDKFAVHRIVEFYRRQPTDYADYFFAAWTYRHRAKLGKAKASLADIAQSERVSKKYLVLIWAILTDESNDSGPIQELRSKWRSLPTPDSDEKAVRIGCSNLAEFVRTRRRAYRVPVQDIYHVPPLNKSTQPMILWKDRDIAANRREAMLPGSDGTPEREQLRAAIARFCSVFPDTFYVAERGRMFLKPGLDKALEPDKRSTGRLLSAGFHLMLGYFRDDRPLYDLILDADQQKQLDRMWDELEFVTEAASRQFSDYIYFERAEQPSFLKSKEFDFAREDTDIRSREKIERLAKLYLAKAKQARINDRALKVIADFFVETSDNIRRLERRQREAEPKHLRALADFAARAWQRPLTDSDRADLDKFYRASRTDIGLTHSEAVRDTLVSILVSPRFGYRTVSPKPGRGFEPLSDHELASRLSYFLWASIPDRALLDRAKSGTLSAPKTLLAQTRRMTKDARIRRFATEFSGHWLDYRRFENHNGVNRERFPQFTNDLRQAMYEEPIRFVTDLIRRDGSVLELVDAEHTFANKVLADHYGMPHRSADPNEWLRIEDASRFGRGGLLPMAVFLTKNAPGLRTSPVKRGYWVVRRLLGEHIPAPPPEVPELPDDESKLGELSVRDVLAKHRQIESCAKCHRRFDSIGLAFEGFGPIGERRSKDLGGKPVDDSATFPDGSEGKGLVGLKRYLRTKRREAFIDNLCRKMLAYALGRSLMLSDESTLAEMKRRLAIDKYRIGSLFETIVTSSQFTKARGREFGR